LSLRAFAKHIPEGHFGRNPAGARAGLDPGTHQISRERLRLGSLITPRFRLVHLRRPLVIYGVKAESEIISIKVKERAIGNALALTIRDDQVNGIHRRVKFQHASIELDAMLDSNELVADETIGQGWLWKLVPNSSEFDSSVHPLAFQFVQDFLGVRGTRLA